MKADGLSNDSVAEALGINKRTVLLWTQKYRNRSADETLDDILSVSGGRGPKEEISGEAKTWIIGIACQKPKDFGYAAETWTNAALTKHIRKYAGEAGYQRQTTHVLSYDEKPGIQAIAAASDELLPTGEHGTMKHDYEYKRLGTVSLLAGIDLQTGEAIPLASDTHNSRDYIAFLENLNGRYPHGDKIRLILDNLKVHSSADVQEYIATVPGRFEFVFTPKHASWLNLVEDFFSKMTKQMLRDIQVETKDELVTRIYKYFDEINETPVVYHWTDG